MVVELQRAELLRPAEEGARLVALRQLDEVRAALARAGDPNDEEAIHDVRVALRRLRSSLASYRPLLDQETAQCGLERAGKLAGQMGDARDGEVRLAWLEAHRKHAKPAQAKALAELGRQLEARLALGRARAIEGLGDRFEELEEELRASLRTYPAPVAPPNAPAPSFALAVNDALRDAADELERALGAVSGPGDARTEHEARIDAKRVRYVLEPVRALLDGSAPVLGELRRLQDLLGERHDRAQLADVLRSALERAALATAQGLAEAVKSRDARAAHRLRTRPIENALLALLATARDESDALWDELASQWLFGKSAPFFGRLRALASELRRMGAPSQEIERKYLLRGLPARVSGAEALEIQQGYLPGGASRERLRLAVGPRGTRFTRTVKVGTGLVRAEYEEEIAPAEFERLWPQTAGARVHKRRYRVPDGELVWEIDEFVDRTLWLAEIELPSADTEVAVPEWLQSYVEREVTGEPSFSNLALSR